MSGTETAVRTVGVAVALALTLTACGGAEPVANAEGFHLSANDIRVYDAYQQDSSVVRKAIRLPAGMQHVRVRIDCIGQGDLDVDVFGGSVRAPCSDESQPGGFIGMTRPSSTTEAESSRLVVRAPKDAVWSVAVDTGSGRIGASGD